MLGQTEGGVLTIETVVTSPLIPKSTVATMFDLNALLTQWNALLIVSVWTVIQVVRRSLPAKYFAEGKLLARLMPLAALVGCNIAMWIPGPWLSPEETWGQRMVLGTFLGALTANFHSIASKLGLHQLLKLEPKPHPLTRD